MQSSVEEGQSSVNRDLEQVTGEDANMIISLHTEDQDLEAGNSNIMNQQDQEIGATQNEQEEESDEFTEIYVWGNDYHGQLGVGSERCIHRLPKVCSFNIVISQVSCGEEHTAFVAQPGGHVYSMGNNTEGKLGVGEHSMKSSNVPCLVEDLAKIVKVECGTQHTLALTEDGLVYSWGQSIYGALGLGQDCKESQYQPKLVEKLLGEKILDIAAGSRHSLFAGELSVYSCGDGKQGQLGIGYIIDSGNDQHRSPVKVEQLEKERIRRVFCGKLHSFFLTEENEVWGSGGNSFGQLGIGSKKNSYIPVKIPELANIKYVSTWHFSGALSQQNQLYIWGTGVFGELLRPKAINMKELLSESSQENVQVTDFRIGGGFAVLLDSQNKTLVWGANTNGEMGLGDTKPRHKPVYLEQIFEKPVYSVGVGGQFAFALGPRLKVGTQQYQTFETEERLSNAIIEEQEEGSSQQDEEETKAEPEQDSQEADYDEEILEKPQKPQSEKKKSVQFSINHSRSEKGLASKEVVRNLRSTVQDLISENQKLANQVKDLKNITETKKSSVKKGNPKEQLELAVAQIAAQEREISELQFRIRDKDQSMAGMGRRNDTLKEENERLQGVAEELKALKAEREEMKKWEDIMKKQIVELEQQVRVRQDYDSVKGENERLRKESDQLYREKQDLIYKMARLQKEHTLKTLSHNNYGESRLEMERKENEQSNRQRVSEKKIQRSSEKKDKGLGARKVELDDAAERFDDFKQLHSCESVKSQLSQTMSLNSYRKEFTPGLKEGQQQTQLNPNIPEFSTSKFGAPLSSVNNTFDYDEGHIVNISSQKNVSYLGEGLLERERKESGYARERIDREFWNEEARRINEHRDVKGILQDKDINCGSRYNHSLSNSQCKQQELQPRVHFSHTIQFDDDPRKDPLNSYPVPHHPPSFISVKEEKNQSSIQDRRYPKYESLNADRRSSLNPSNYRKNEGGGLGYESMQSRGKLDWKRPSLGTAQERSNSKRNFGSEQSWWQNQRVAKINEKSEYEPVTHFLHKPIIHNKVGTIHAERELNPNTQYECARRVSSPFEGYYKSDRHFTSNERPSISKVAPIQNVSREEEIRRRVEKRMQKENYQYERLKEGRSPGYYEPNYRGDFQSRFY